MKALMFALMTGLLVAALSAQDTPTRGGVKPGQDTLMFAYASDPNTINPIIANDTTSGAFMQWVIEALADRKFSNPDEWEPVLAESWDFNKDRLEYTIRLRKGILWQPTKYPDGTVIPAKEFTSADVKFTFDCILNRHVNAGSIRSYYEDPDAQEESEKIKITVDVVDDYTVKIRWKKPYFQIFEFTFGIGIIPKHVYSVDEKGEAISLDTSGEEFAKGFNEHWHNSMLCGTGPLMLSEWKKNEHLELVRNPKYWGKPFYFSKVKFKNVPNPNTVRQMLLGGELDWASIGEKILYVQTKDDPAVKKTSKVKLVEYDYPSYVYLGYNQKRPVFRQREVRWALGHAIPLEKIIDKVMLGYAKRLSGPFLPGSSSYNDKLSLIPYDPAKAKTMLEAAGWKDTNNNGLRDKNVDGKQVEMKFDLIIPSKSPQYQTIAEILKEEFRQVGVELQISPVEWATMLDKLNKKEFDTCILGWALGWKQDPFQIFHGSQSEVPDSSNFIGYDNKDLNKLIETLRITIDDAEQKKLYHEIHRIIHEDQPYTFFYVTKATSGHLARINNVNFYRIRPCYDAREWFAKPEDARK